MTTRTSVIIPVRNGSRYIAQAIHSALVQLASEDEVIVVDDASTDNTKTLVSEITDRRIVILDGFGLGVSSARNTGLAAANGEFIAFLDHDDLWPIDRHAILLRTLTADTSLDAAVGRLRLLIEADAVMPPQIPAMEGKLAPNLSLCTALFRRRILDRVGYFAEDMHFCEDTDYFVRLVEYGYRTALCDADTLIYRRHATNATCDLTSLKDGLLDLMRRRISRQADRETKA